MLNELLPKADISDNDVIGPAEMARKRVKPPEGYYLCCPCEKYCSCAFVLTNGPFNKVTVEIPTPAIPG